MTAFAVAGTEKASRCAAMDDLPCESGDSGVGGATSRNRSVVVVFGSCATDAWGMQELHRSETRLIQALLSRQDQRWKGPWRMTEACGEARRIGEVIRRARVLRRRSQKEVAAALGCHQSKTSRLESGRGTEDIRVLRAVVQELGIPF